MGALWSVLLPELIQRERRSSGMATLVAAIGVGALECLGFVLDGQHSVADREALQRKIHQRPRAFFRHDLEMIGFAADYDAQCDECTEAPAARRQCNCTRKLERTRHR